MAAYAAWQRYDTAIVVGVSVTCMGVIAVAFLAPEQLFDSTLGLTIFFVAVVLMVACAVIANIYDLRAMLADTFSWTPAGTISSILWSGLSCSKDLIPGCLDYDEPDEEGQTMNQHVDTELGQCCDLASIDVEPCEQQRCNNCRGEMGSNHVRNVHTDCLNG